MKKLTASLIALALCAFMPIAQAWHVERFVTENGMNDVRIIYDDEKENSSSTPVTIDLTKEEKEVKPVERFEIEKRGTNLIIIDSTNFRKWSCRQGASQMTCERTRYY